MLNFLITIIVIVGAFNWGIIGILGTNVVERICSASLARGIYILIGFCGLVQLILLITAEKGLKYLS